MEKYGVAINAPLDFKGLVNYTKQREEINDAINSLLIYLKCSGKNFYFEHNCFETDEYVLWSERDTTKNHSVKMDWVLIGFNSEEDRTSEDDDCPDDLVIAIDNFKNGKSMLRMHFPECYIKEFRQHYQTDEKAFSDFDEQSFVKHIYDIISII